MKEFATDRPITRRSERQTHNKMHARHKKKISKGLTLKTQFSRTLRGHSRWDHYANKRRLIGSPIVDPRTPGAVKSPSAAGSWKKTSPSSSNVRIFGAFYTELPMRLRSEVDLRPGSAISVGWAKMHRIRRSKFI